jgi:hypothetical protein
MKLITFILLLYAVINYSFCLKLLGKELEQFSSLSKTKTKVKKEVVEGIIIIILYQL